MVRPGSRGWLRAGLILLALVLGCGPVAAATTRQAGARDERAAEDSAQVAWMVRLVNQRRELVGCRKLVWDPRLAEVARKHSAAMAAQGFFSHVDLRGNTPFDRMDKAGIRFQAAAENIASGPGSAPDVYEGWISSPGHRENLENCRYTHHGIGLVRGRWTHLFAKF